MQIVGAGFDPKVLADKSGILLQLLMNCLLLFWAPIPRCGAHIVQRCLTQESPHLAQSSVMQNVAATLGVISKDVQRPGLNPVYPLLHCPPIFFFTMSRKLRLKSRVLVKCLARSVIMLRLNLGR